MPDKITAVCRKLLIEKSGHSGIQFMRSLYVGIIATFLDIFFLFFLKEYLHIYYLLSAGISYFAGMVLNYLLSNKWVFDQRALEKNKFLEFSIFAFITSIGLIFLEILMWVLTGLFRLYYLFSKVIAAFLIFTWNFWSRKKILYSKKIISNK